MIPETIKKFSQQLSFNPVIENASKLRSAKSFIIAGMGGSHLAADLLKTWDLSAPIIVHSNYALPHLSIEELKQSLIIASSYSGNTEETIDSFEKARSRKLKVAAISTGGKLLKLAKKYDIPFIQLPDVKIQPRSAIGFSVVAMLKLMGEEKELTKIKQLSRQIKPADTEKEGKMLAEKLRGLTPIIYSSATNFPIAYNWKIRFNETGKIPAFCNAIPEANHNEILGFVLDKGAEIFSKRFGFIFLNDQTDHKRNKLRMEILSGLYEKAGLTVARADLKGKTVWEKIFNSLILADWTSYYAAKLHGFDPEEENLVDKFKEIIKPK